MEIYIADVRMLGKQQKFLENCELFSEERRGQIKRLRNFDDKLRSMGAELLLEYALQKRGYTLEADIWNKKQVHVVRGDYGKPYFADLKELYFNLSHSGIYAAAVFAEGEVGIDIERIRSVRPALVHRFFTEKEAGCLEKIRLERNEEFDLSFTRLWTRKESYIKAVGEGLRLSLATFEVLSDIVEGNTAYHLRTWELPGGYILSVCAKEAITAEIVPVDLQEIIKRMEEIHV